MLNHIVRWEDEFHDTLAGNRVFKKYSYVSWWMQISHDDASIAFKFHNFVQVTFYHHCEKVYNTFIYLNQYVAHVIEHGINIKKNILLFHGLRYYHNMM
jgi:hypothetical protein